MPRADERGEMHDRVEFRFSQHAIEDTDIAEIAKFEAAAEESVAMAGREVVQNGDLVTALEQQPYHVRADVTSAAADEDVHRAPEVKTRAGL